MRSYTLLLAFWSIACLGSAQSLRKSYLSAVLMSPDSVAIPDVSIINTRTEQVVRSNSKGFFQIETEEGDSLVTNHIAFRKRIITEADNAQIIILEPEITELLQVDITSSANQEDKQMERLEQSICQIAKQKKLDGFDKKTRQICFYDQHGSYNRGFSPYFGPSLAIPFEKIARLFKRKNKR